MTFGDFARNYLNPFYLAYRAGLLFGAGGCLMVALSSDESFVVKIPVGLLGLWLAWTGIRPWGDGRGISANNL